MPQEIPQSIHAVFDKFPRAVIIHDGGKPLYCNPAALKLMGFARMEEFFAVPNIRERIAGPDKARMQQRFDAIERGEHVADEYEVQVEIAPGKVRWLSAVRSRVAWDGIDAVLLTLVDITEAKHDQEALRRSRTLLQTVFDSMPMWLWVKDREGRYLMVNQKMAGDLRIPLDRLGELRANDLGFQTELQESIAQKEQAVIATAKPMTTPEVGANLPDGSNVVLTIVRSPLLDENREVTGLVGVGVDITDLKRTEATLRANEERYRALIEGSVQGVGIFSLRDHRALFVNEAMLRLTGETDAAGYLRTVNLFDRIREPYAGTLRKLVQNLADGSMDTFRDELSAYRADGSSYWAEFIARRIEWDGEPAVQFTVQDITSRKQAEEALKDHQAVLIAQNTYFKQDLGRLRERKGEGIVAASPVMRRVLQEAENAAKSRVPILIEGETGVGKELIAEFIHRHSDRAEHVMTVVNCGALTENLMDAELFGYERGAFTGATEARAGLAEVADHGTLFLDEIGDLPASGQVRLLRFLERGVVRRVGSTREKRVDVRILAATHKNLKQQMEAGTFREDLYHRLLVIRIEVPPLRERIEDILPLAVGLLDAACQDAHLASRTFSPEARLAMTTYAWPGNVRELSHSVQRALFASQLEGTTEIQPQHLDLPASQGGNANGMTMKQYLRQAEQRHVREVLSRVQGNRRRAAEALGISERQLYRLLE